MIPRLTCKRIMKEAVKEDKVLIGSDAITYAITKAEEFIENLTKNTIPILKEDNKKTIRARELEIVLDTRSLILSNLPKAVEKKQVEKEAYNEEN